MTYAIDQDETNVRWIVNCDDHRSECTGTPAYDRYEWAREAALRDARRLKARMIWLTTRGHEAQRVEIEA